MPAIFISFILLLGLSIATTGCLNDNGIVTGTIEVKYNSALGNDVYIYLEDDTGTERLGRIPSDEWATFDGIDPGEYTISATTLGDEILDSTRITVDRGETTRVELSYW